MPDSSTNSLMTSKLAGPTGLLNGPCARGGLCYDLNSGCGGNLCVCRSGFFEKSGLCGKTFPISCIVDNGGFSASFVMFSLQCWLIKVFVCNSPSGWIVGALSRCRHLPRH